jgi:hypothetical protein
MIALLPLVALLAADVDVVVPDDVAAEEAAVDVAAPAPTFPGLQLPQVGTDLSDRLRRERVLMKGLQAERLSAGHTVVGGYAQINASALSVGAGDNGEMLNDLVMSANLRRLVLFVAHTFTDDLRFYTEFEWEHAIACRTCSGASEIEQAFVEWDIVEDNGPPALTARGGLVLIPFGILNQWHEPPVFHGVDRARLEEGLIPSTWRELGGGIVGELHPGLSYELYLTTGLDPVAFTSSGVINGRQNGSLVDASSVMVSGRLELEPVLGAIVAVSALYNETGGLPFSSERFTNTAGDPVRLTLPLMAIEADARIRRGGLEARTLITSWHYPNAGDLMQAKRIDGSPTIIADDATKTGAMATQMVGAQLEVAYDVFAPFAFTEQQLLPFARVEFVNTQFAVPDGYVADLKLSTKELTLGLSYRPIPQVVLKSDVQLRNRLVGDDEVQGNLGLGLMF